MNLSQVAARALLFRRNETDGPERGRQFRTLTEACVADLFFRYNENHDPDNGQFTSGSGGGSGGTVEPTETKLDIAPALNAKAINVGGDQFNRETAVRLETEYQRARPALDEIVAGAAGEEVESHHDDDEDEDKPYVPDEWDVLSNDQQEDAKSQYVQNNKSEYIDNEVSYYHDSGNALDDAKSSLAHNFDSDAEWAQEALQDYLDAREENGKPVPYTADQILSAISLDYQDGYEGKGDLTVDFNDDKLMHPSTLVEGQLDLPGIEPIVASAALSIEMRDEIEKVIDKAFDKQADKDEGDVEAPDYIAEQAVEQLEESWESMDDSDKFSWVENNTDIIKDAENAAESYSQEKADSGIVEIPDTFDPLQQEGGADYKATQRLAAYLSLERQKQLVEARGIKADLTFQKTSVRDSDIQRVDTELWKGWVGSSTNFAGSILQLAASKELGGRFRELQTHSTDLIKQANDKYKSIGGFEGIKALVRAKWETTQYLLDKAGIHEVDVYRGLKIELSDADRAKIQEVEVPNPPPLSQDSTIYKRIPDVNVVRNGAMSTTTNPTVANGWGAGQGTKVVLRISAPRTSVLSVPAYGINVHSEKEVVIAGTAWKGWDAWKDQAPTFEQVPMKAAA